MFGSSEPLEIILILVVILLLFGAKKLPDMARSLGKSARILKSEAKAMKKDGAQHRRARPAPPQHRRRSPRRTARTIQAAPGDVTSSRPVTEPNRHHHSADARTRRPPAACRTRRGRGLLKSARKAGEGPRGADAPRGPPA